MTSSRVRQAEGRGTSVALAFERARGAEVIDTSYGDVRASGLIRAAILAIGGILPPRVSCDFVSTKENETRLIEVKARGSRGDIKIIERELDTLAAAGRCGWLYVVWNVTQPFPVRLLTIQDPARLGWTVAQPAQRAPGEFRGARHEAVLQLTLDEVTAAATEVDLTGLLTDSWAGAERD